jgi:ketosteroid isomerase-like protein
MPATTPEQVDELFSAAFNAGDVDGLVSLYEPTAPLLAHTGEIIAAPEARRAYVIEMLSLGARIDLRTSKVEVNGDLALVFSPWSLTATNPDGSPLRMAGDSVVVLRRQQDGMWRFAIDDPGWHAPQD